MPCVKILSEFIKEKSPNFEARIGIILGTGLASAAQAITDPIIIPYSTLPGFPVSTVSGHHGRLILGYLKEIPVACYQGRIHYYEGATGEDFKIFIRTLKSIGCRILLLTNAAGSLSYEVKPGQIALIHDHINFMPGNPLVGSNNESFGPRFFAMDNAYDKKLRQILQNTADLLHIPLTQGVYASVVGPGFETPAEIKALKILGADFVGMSTVPEVLVARHCGMRVAALSAITNFASGMNEESITHQGSLDIGGLAAKELSQLIVESIRSLYQDEFNE